MTGKTAAAIAVFLAVVATTSVLALPFVGVGFGPIGDGEADEGGVDGASDLEATPEGSTADTGDEPLSMPSPATDGDGDGDDANSASQPQLQDDREDVVEAGVDAGIELAEEQGVEVTQEQREAALEGAAEFAARHGDADDEQVREATKGAVHGSLVASQEVNVTAIQYAVGGAVDGALAQYTRVEANQMQSAAWGATHGAIAQEQRVTVEQIQVATRGAAAGAASGAATSGVEHGPTIREAGQGAAYGVLSQYQKLTVEQRQQVSLEHVQHAAAGASAGVLEGATETLAVEAEQYQRIDVKQVQKAAIGASKGALVQRQRVTVEQTQSAARGASKGAAKAARSVTVQQVQRITITAIQEASFGAAKGAIQRQEATVEQIQAAADGGARGTLVQRQEVSITQIQSAATGAAKGAVESAVQYQVVEVEAIQAAAAGAGEGAVLQKQVVDVVQVQRLASGSATGALSQYQEATVEQIQVAATSASQETARAVQSQRISVSQLQRVTAETAADATAYAVDEGTADPTVLVQYVEVEVVQRIERIDEREGEATISFDDQESDGDSVVIDSVELSEGGFVAVYDGVTVDADPDAVLGASAYLEPGGHENVTVEFDEPLEESRPLVAVVHHDTTDDETFRYVESDGEDDEPYVSDGGGPVLDGAFVTVEADEPEPEPEPEATLSVTDQAGDGETLTVDEANATVDYLVSAQYNGERVDSDVFAAGEPVEDLSLALEPPLEENATVDVSVRDAADDEALATESIEYTVEDDTEPEPEPEPEPPEPAPDANLTVTDQRGDGETVTIEAANATVDYALTVAEADAAGDDPLVETDPFPADESLENETIDLDDPLEADATLEAAVIDATDGDVLANETFEYTLDEGFEVEFVDCRRAEVSDSFEEGDSIAASTGFYTLGGFGNTIAEDFVTVGEDVEAPFTGTIVFEVDGEADDRITRTADDEVMVAVGDYGSYGTAITGITSPEAFPVAGIDHPNPEGEECIEETRPELPSTFVAETTVVDDGEGDEPPTIDVTFGYENPNDAPVLVRSELEGATEDEPLEELAPGEGTFTVEWTPETEDERLVWTADMSIYDYDEVFVAETDPAGEIADFDEEPEQFVFEMLATNAPVEQGEDLLFEATVANVGERAGAQTVELALDGTVVDATEPPLELEAGNAATVSLTAETADLEPGAYTATISTDNETVETTVTLEAPTDTGDAGIGTDDGGGTDGNGIGAGVGGDGGNDGDEFVGDENGIQIGDDPGAGIESTGTAP
ncbi:hypothetical protein CHINAEXTREME_09520 [Halobiforma lacisalsi AJ5]|uniref:Uncharacterized protein n=1 Tax=Natronobacterium lacisalsi AJ5 TaxID=358396 RepID=M0L7X3_NATLA|nr:CARDB domain-containing protein [Halobiforma lacisalsi]APW98004.1 hypothetical protein CHINAEXTREME_09520 [Halobiforma lacisalsi AJ5]EMA28559.1 hypothetical protein C445_18081 [Halobiforma lacisalsi AJ5]